MRTSLLRNDSLSKSATNVLRKSLKSVGVNFGVPYRGDESGIVCSICLEGMDEEEGNLFTVSLCSHTFHKHCIARWKEVSRRCPCCRGPLSDDIGPTHSRIQNPPVADVPSDMPTLPAFAIFGNVIFGAVGIFYPLLLLSLFIPLVVFCSALIIPYYLLVCYCVRYMPYNSAIGNCGVICIMLLLFVPCFPVVSLGIIFHALYRTLKFYAFVFMCKTRWTSAYSFIIGRTFFMIWYMVEMVDANL